MQSLQLQHTQIQQLQHDEELTQTVLATTTYTHSDTTTTTWWGTDADSPCDYNIHSLRYNYNMMRNCRRQSLQLQHTLSYNYNMMRNCRRQSLRLQHTHSVTTTTWWWTNTGSHCKYINNTRMNQTWRHGTDWVEENVGWGIGWRRMWMRDDWPGRVWDWLGGGECGWGMTDREGSGTDWVEENVGEGWLTGKGLGLTGWRRMWVRDDWPGRVWDWLGGGECGWGMTDREGSGTDWVEENVGEGWLTGKGLGLTGWRRMWVRNDWPGRVWDWLGGGECGWGMTDRDGSGLAIMALYASSLCPNSNWCLNTLDQSVGWNQMISLNSCLHYR